MALRVPNGSAVTPRTQSSMRSASSWTKIEVSSSAPAGKNWFPGRLPARPQQRAVGDDHTAPDQGDAAVVGVVLIDHAQPTGAADLPRLARTACRTCQIQRE
jgi:hypothetical protein